MTASAAIAAAVFTISTACYPFKRSLLSVSNTGVSPETVAGCSLKQLLLYQWQMPSAVAVPAEAATTAVTEPLVADLTAVSCLWSG